MKSLFPLILLIPITLTAQNSGADTGVENITQIKRVYVAPLTGGAQASAMRDLIIASLTATKLFVLTDNSERADAILRGAADDKTFTDTYDSTDNVSGHANVSKTSGASSIYTHASGLALGDGGSQDESHHIRERKHEAYATVRLCNKDGDVLWSTTQESLGAKFRGASADVAARIAHQITIDFEKERRLAQSPGTATATINAPPITAK